MRKGYYGLSVFLADRIGDLPKLHVVTDMIFKLSARLKRNGIYHEMIVNVIRVKMGGNNYFVICPHIRFAVSTPIRCASAGATSSATKL